MHKSNPAGIFAVRVDDEEWKETRSLSGAGPEDNVFVVDRSTGQVVFGDGTHGRLPSVNAVVTVSYRDGGGAANGAHVSITTRWPPTEGGYRVALSTAGVGIGKDGGDIKCFAGTKRVRYFAGQMLSADDFQAEQQYLIQRRHVHNLALHGSGIVTGMAVIVSGDTPFPSLVVEPGLALDPHGREIELAAPVVVQVGNPGCPHYVIIQYAEKEADLVPLLPEGTLMASRIEEGASIHLSPGVPPDDGIALARVVPDSTGWKVDSTFKPRKCR